MLDRSRVGGKDTSASAVGGADHYAVGLPLHAQAERLAKMGSWVWDLQTDQMTWSDELFRILGHEPQKVEPSIGQLYGAIHPGDADQVKAACANLQANGKPFEIPCRVVHRDGRPRYVILAATGIVDGEGEVERLAGTILDVTGERERNRELRRANRLLRETQRLAHIGSWEWDMRTNEVKWSDELRRIFGEDEGFQPSPESFRQRVHAKDLERMQWLYSSLRKSDIDEPVEFRIVRRDEQIRYVYLESRSVHDLNGALVGYVGTIQDITDRKRLEAQALQSQKMEAIGRLAGGVAHDFNNVLMAILANASVLQMTNPCQELDDIVSAAEDGAALARQLLALSRQSAISFETVDLNQICHGTLHLVERVLGDDIDIVLSLTDNVWPVQAATVQLKQVLLNLCINARDALPDGGTITIETHNVVLDAEYAREHPHVRPGQFVHMVVADNGVGMDEDTRARAFEPFFTTKGPGRGSGLGLATVFAVIKQSNGCIDIATAPGRGTRFDIYLPRSAVTEELAVIEAPLRRDRVLGDETILVVEDNPMVAVSIGRVLAQAGYNVLHAARPSEAIAAAAEHRSLIRAVITDYIMPEMRGPELVKKLAENGSRLPVVFVSGYAPADDERLKLSNARFLQKPFRGDALLLALRESLDSAIAAR